MHRINSSIRKCTRARLPPRGYNSRLIQSSSSRAKPLYGVSLSHSLSLLLARGDLFARTRETARQLGKKHNGCSSRPRVCFSLFSERRLAFFLPLSRCAFAFAFAFAVASCPPPGPELSFAYSRLPSPAPRLSLRSFIPLIPLIPLISLRLGRVYVCKSKCVKPHTRICARVCRPRQSPGAARSGRGSLAYIVAVTLRDWLLSRCDNPTTHPAQRKWLWPRPRSRARGSERAGGLFV